MIIVQGEVYLEEWHIAILKKETEFVRKRYQAVARTLVSNIIRITRNEAAGMIDRSRRQLQRIVRRFREQGIAGLRLRSTRPHNNPHKTTANIETRIVDVRKATGFGSEQLSIIVNQSTEHRNSRTTAYNIMVRYELVKAEKLIQQYTFFERDRPDELVQADLTRFNGIPLLTMEDDYSRKGWAMRLKDELDDTVVAGMKMLHGCKYQNLLTDNGSQFCRRNSVMRKYCEHYLTERHIWSSIHHPQTLGKLSAFQKGMKRFLRHRLKDGQDTQAIDECISVYLDWYNNGMQVSTTGCYPEGRYSGKRDSGCYARLIKALKLDWMMPLVVGGG